MIQIAVYIVLGILGLFRAWSSRFVIKTFTFKVCGTLFEGMRPRADGCECFMARPRVRVLPCATIEDPVSIEYTDRVLCVQQVA